MKRIGLGILCCLVFFHFGLGEVAAEAKTLGELRAAYNEVLRKKQENDNKTDAAKQEIAAKEAAVKQAEADIHKAEGEMEDAQKAIDESNEKIKKLKLEAEKALLYLQQMQGENAYVEYVSGATTMTELITRIAAVEQVSDSIRTSMEDLEKEIQRNEELKVELADKKAKLEAQAEEYKKVIQARHQDIASYDKYAVDIVKQEEAARKNLEMYEKLCRENAGSTADSVELSSCSKVPVNTGWLKPLKSGVITSEVGYRWGSYHNALDIGGNAEGTPIYAPAAGVVSAMIPYTSCGGNMLFIDVTVNGKKYTTFFFHLLRYNVKLGDVVSQDSIIGYVGGGSTASYDSCTFGAHLHYGVATGWFDVSYGYVRQSTIITPPGFPNQYGWRFNARTDWYAN